MKKTLCLILCLVILTLSLNACNLYTFTKTDTETETEPATEPVTTSAISAEPVQTLPKGYGDIYMIYSKYTTDFPNPEVYYNQYYEFVTENCIKIEVVAGKVIYLPLSSIIAIREKEMP